MTISTVHSSYKIVCKKNDFVRWLVGVVVVAFPLPTKAKDAKSIQNDNGKKTNKIYAK